MQVLYSFVLICIHLYSVISFILCSMMLHFCIGYVLLYFVYELKMMMMMMKMMIPPGRRKGEYRSRDGWTVSTET